MIIGASRGIGLEFARQYAEDGWSVHATTRDSDGAAALRRLVGDIYLHHLDVRDDDALLALDRALGDRAIDLLIHNAGIRVGGPEALGTLAPERWLDVLHVNTIAPMRCAGALCERVAAGERKMMAFISSWRGSISENEDGGLYMLRSSKAALNACVKSLAIDLAPHGIIAVALHPGWVRTDMGGAAAPLAVADGVVGLRSVIAGLTPMTSGRFFAYDGREIAW